MAANIIPKWSTGLPKVTYPNTSQTESINFTDQDQCKPPASMDTKTVKPTYHKQSSTKMIINLKSTNQKKIT